MTLHDDPDLQLLERDLRMLAAPREGDERIRLALRQQLDITSPPRPRRRVRIRLAFALPAVAAAVAAIALAALVGTTGSGGPTADAAIVHHALGALTPRANTILHVKVVGVQNGVAVAGETWQETSAPYASRGIKGEAGHQGEFAVNATTSFAYDARTNIIYEQPDSSAPTFADPISQVRQELASGQAHPAGTVMIDGNALYKIDLPHGLVGYFDTSDYQPRYLDDPQRDGSVVRLRVAAYEYLPMTPSNRALLSVTAQHPGARIEAGPTGQLGK